MKSIFFSLSMFPMFCIAQINWAQFDLPPLPVGVSAIAHDIKFDITGDGFIPMDAAGVLVFDGSTSIFYNGDNVPVLLGRNIVAVEIDQNNLKWFLDGSTLNLITFDGTNWSLVPESITGANVIGHSIKFDQSGNLWSTFYSDDYNLAKFDGTGWTFYNSYNPPTNSDWFLPLKIDLQGRLVWCDRDCVHWFDGINSDTANISQLLGWNGIASDMEIDAAGDVWLLIFNNVVNQRQLVHYNGSGWEAENLSFGFGNIDYRPRMMLNDDTVWIPTGNFLWNNSNGSWQSEVSNTNFHATDISIDMYERWWFFTTDTLNDDGNNFITVFDADGMNTISGTVYFDLDTNGVRDAGEPPYRNQLLHLMPLNYYQFTDDSGNYEFGLMDSSGVYDVTLLPPQDWYITSSPQIYNIVQSVNQEVTPNIDFGMAPNIFYDDAVAGAAVFGPKRLSTDLFTASVYNNGTTFMSGTIQLDLDPDVQYVTANVTPDQINGNGILWNYTGLFPGNSKSIQVTYYVPASVNTGDTLVYTVSATPFNTDVDQTNNIINLEAVVLSAYDPNMKTVYPTGDGSEGYIQPETMLMYTVYFQNTGNAPAEHVTVYDELDQDLDITSFQVIAFSHSYELTIIQDDVLKFDFPSIMLPDSGANEPESHGFIQYRIKPIVSCPEGTAITNSASIFFDLNEPVITNTTLNTLSGPTAVPDVVNEEGILSVFPNPFSEVTTVSFTINEVTSVIIELFDLHGRKIKTIASGNFEEGSHLLSFLVEDFIKGVYFLQIQTSSGSTTQKLIIE